MWKRNYDDIFEATKDYLRMWMKISDDHRDAIMDLMGTERYDLLLANGSNDAFVDLDDDLLEKTKHEHYHFIMDTSSVPKRITNCLRMAGYRYWEDVVKHSPDDILSIRYIGETSLWCIMHYLEELGIDGYLFRCMGKTVNRKILIDINLFNSLINCYNENANSDLKEN